MFFRNLAFCVLAAACLIAAAAQTVTIEWSDVQADTYSVYRATGPCATATTFTLRAQGVTGTVWTDSGLTSGTYCYYATAVENGVESEAGHSMEISLRPVAPGIKSLKSGVAK